MTISEGRIQYALGLAMRCVARVASDSNYGSECQLMFSFYYLNQESNSLVPLNTAIKIANEMLGKEYPDRPGVSTQRESTRKDDYDNFIYNYYLSGSQVLVRQGVQK